MDRKGHWERVFTTKSEKDLSWFEPFPAVSLEMIAAAGISTDTCIVDIGGGDSHLVDALLSRGLDCLAVLDVSAVALERAQRRLGGKASIPNWIAADVTGNWTLKPMDIWHDRAVFHFLTDADDRQHYRTHLRRTLKIGGSAIFATFALDGPEKCSGLHVRRYSSETLAAELGTGFRLEHAVRHLHRTPWGGEQQFQYSRFTRVS